MNIPLRSTAAVGVALALLLNAPVLPASAADSAHTLNCRQADESPGETRARDVLRAPEPLLDSTGTAAKAFAGFFVEQAIAQHADTTYVGFYDADRVLNIAHRTGSTGPWTFAQPRSGDGSLVILGRDTHNSIALTVDAHGAVHLIANVFSSEMNYWRSEPDDPTTLVPADHLVVTPSRNGAGARQDDEGYVTYPRFLTGPDGTLRLMWHAGWSGAGKTYIYEYDAEKSRWSNPLGGSAVLDGWSGSTYSPYPDLPRYNPADGYHYLSYTWQDDGSAASASTINLIRTKDFRTWSAPGGAPLDTPLRYGTEAAFVENVPENSGILNTNVRTGFDPGGRATVAYVRERDRGTVLTLSRRDGLDRYWIHTDVSEWQGHNDLSDPSELARLLLGGGTEVDGEEMTIPYNCHGESRVLRVGYGAFNGQSRYIGDAPQSEGTLPAAITDSEFPGSGYALTHRLALADTDAGTLVLKWEAGPMIANGASPDPNRFPVDGSTLSIALLGR